MRPLLDPNSAVFALAVELYQWHAQDQWGRCACRTPNRERGTALDREGRRNGRTMDWWERGSAQEGR
jgi:hypothetical protein